jgi:hypothetical protein
MVKWRMLFPEDYYIGMADGLEYIELRKLRQHKQQGEADSTPTDKYPPALPF